MQYISKHCVPLGLHFLPEVSEAYLGVGVVLSVSVTYNAYLVQLVTHVSQFWYEFLTLCWFILKSSVFQVLTQSVVQALG